ncbi:MAG: penicillin-binding protein 2 [Candidatus Moraniibacteriota bacterium]
MHHSLNFQSKRTQKESSLSDRYGRIGVLVMAIFVVGIFLIARLWFIQVMSHDKWVAIAENQHNAFQELSADRGEIYIHDGEDRYPLAVNREYQMVYASPKDVTEKDKTTVELSRILGIDAGIIKDKLDIPGDPFEIIKKRLSDDEINGIKLLNLKGIAFLPEKYRYYPAGQLASQVIGFMGSGEKSVASGYGIESSKDALLSGEGGTVTQEKDASGRWLPLSDRTVVSPRNGDSLLLTIDRVVQYETEKILKESVEKYQADSATAIVMDPKTGSILSMASFPQFDPNTYSEEEDYSVFLNPAVSMSYEPGSVMKPITMAMGIEEGKISPMTEYVDTGSVSESGYVIHNSENKTYGRSTMTKVLELSINTGVIYVEKLIGNQVFSDYFKNFGFGKVTSVPLPAELAGSTNNLNDVRATLSFFTASFGQGITATPMQMIDAYAVLANGGKLMKPRIIDRILHADGQEEKIQPEVIRQVVSEETSRAVGTMLRSVVVNGHGKQANVPGYVVVGKTGTAQVAKSDAKGYQDGLSIGSFVGYAPLDDPKFVVLVKLNNPKTVEWAESSAAPTFGRIMKFLLEYAKIKPTEEVPVKK